MLTNSNSLQGQVDERREGDVTPADRVQEKRSKLGEGIATASEESQVRPGIEFVFDGQQANFRRQAAIAKLRAVRVALPTHAVEQSAIAQTKRDQITAAAMIRP